MRIILGNNNYYVRVEFLRDINYDNVLKKITMSYEVYSL